MLTAEEILGGKRFHTPDVIGRGLAKPALPANHQRRTSEINSFPDGRNQTSKRSSPDQLRPHAFDELI